MSSPHPEHNVPGIQEGDILGNGKFRVERVLGVGGMGVVVAARHLQLDERVALKFLLPDVLENSEAVARFLQEGRAAVKIKNEHVARVTDVGTLDNGAPYLVMEYLEGQDLAHLLRQRGPLPIEEVVELVLQASEAVSEAHGLGIVHRDLKPGNIFVTRRADRSACVKVLDFGISKVTGLGGSGPDMRMTKTTTVMGSPMYMSPEQMESSRTVDARTDIWAIGIILYELLTSKLPFHGETLPEICMKIATHPVPPLRALRPDAPQGLEAVIQRCLEKQRSRRYANMAELAVALVEFGPKRARISAERISQTIEAAGLMTAPVAAPSSGVRVETAKFPTGAHAAWGRTSPPRSSTRRAIAWIVAALVVSAIGLGIFLFKRPDPEMSAAASSTLPASLAPPSVPPPAPVREVEPPPLPGPDPTPEPALATAPTANSPSRVEEKPTALRNGPKVQPKPVKPAVAANPTPTSATPARTAAPEPKPTAKPEAPASGSMYDDRR